MNSTQGEALQILIDEREIRNVLLRYVHAVDRLDEEELGTIYHPGAFDNHGPLRGPESFYIPAVMGSLRSEFTFCSHTLGPSSITFEDANSARVETYVIAVTGRNADGAEKLYTTGGRFLDRFERRDDRWRIADRVFVPDWDHRSPRDRWQLPEQWAQATRDRNDPSYFGRTAAEYGDSRAASTS